MDKEKFDRTSNEIESLVGDTNLFMLENEDDELNPSFGDDVTPKRTTAETEIMIAESSAQRKRFGWEAMLLMLAFGQRTIGCTRFVAKIGFANQRSIQMFVNMQFTEVSRSEVFEEITFERLCTDDWLQWLAANVEYTINAYNEG